MKALQYIYQNPHDQLLYIFGKYNHRIQVFTSLGEYREMVYRRNKEDHGLSAPQDVILDQNGTLIISDSGNDRIILILQSGDVEVFWTSGKEPGQFSQPQSLALTKDGNLLVADHHGHRLQIFQYH